MKNAILHLIFVSIIIFFVSNVYAQDNFETSNSQTLTRKGLCVNACLSVGYSIMNDANIDTENEWKWKTPKGKFGAISGWIGAEYYFTENFGVGLGIGYGTFETKYGLVAKDNEIKAGEKITIDELDIYGGVNSVEYPVSYTISDGAYLNRKFTTIEIPLYLTYLLNTDSDNSGFYVQVGAKYSFITNKNCGGGTISENLIFEDGTSFFQLVNPSNDLISNQKNADVAVNYDSKSGIFMILSAGWLKPIGNGRHYFTLGPVIEYGFDISDGEFTDVFKNKTNRKVSPLKIGVEFGICFKLTK